MSVSGAVVPISCASGVLEASYEPFLRSQRWNETDRKPTMTTTMTTAVVTDGSRQSLGPSISWDKASLSLLQCHGIKKTAAD